MNIGFIGLGNMGSGMAANVLRFAKEGSHALCVFDIYADAMTPLVEAGALAGTSTADVARRSDVLFTSLPSSKEVNLLALGPDGILENMPIGQAPTT